MKKKLFNSIILPALVVLLAACGPSGPTTNIEVTMTEFAFTPDEFMVPAGQEISLSATNNGAIVHEFVIFKLGTDPDGQFREDDEPNVYWEVEVLPGDTVETSFTAPGEVGEYYVTCHTAGHLEAGMIGSLIVVAAAE